MTDSPPNTKEQIIMVAERLFAEHGFDGTTLRNVVSEAGVNLAAVSYHFGSKEDLYRAVVAKYARPVVDQELYLLSELQKGLEPISVEGILTALIKPSLVILSQHADSHLVTAQFMGRCRTEPEPIQSIANEEYDAASQAFLDVLQRILPDQSRSQLSWKLDLVIAALIRVLTEAGKPFALLKSNSSSDIEETTQQLVRFLSPGMRS
ncbi:MAG: TetR/AcrR family transcriptional regulator [Pseudanabaena sp.]|nr:MAG: TetR/AcrR family transcriptional regulator [Pseudanabaena sp.]